MNFASGSTGYIAAAFAAAFIVSFIAFRLRMLSVSGAIAAGIIGGIIFAFGGIIPAVMLLSFFLSGSLLGRLNGARGEQRNWKQVFCNGAVPAIAVILIAFRHDLREEISLLFIGALATATADTWATEIGTRFGKKYYNIFTFRPTERGTSGGVSLIGIGAGILGALMIALIALIRFSVYDPVCELIFVKVIPVIIISGFFGALIDSFIGATIQAKYKLPDGTITESKTKGAALHSGISFIGNNATNLIATIWGGVIAIWLGGVL